MLLCENKVINFHIKQNYGGGGVLYYTQKLQAIKCETVKTYTLHGTPAENVDVAGSRPYTWSGYEQRKRMATKFYPQPMLKA